jgi:hypothetical protein
MAAAAVVTVSMGVMKPVLAKLTTLMGELYKKIKDLRKKVTFLQVSSATWALSLRRWTAPMNSTRRPRNGGEI